MKKGCAIIGLVGLPGAGKTTAASYLEKFGYYRVTLSDFIKEEAKKDGVVEATREQLQDYGNLMRVKYGPQVLAQLAYKKIREKGIKKAAIDGIRNLYEVAFLGVENNFTLVGIIGLPKIRYSRMLKRKDRPVAPSFKIFLKQEHREEGLGSKEIGLRVKECLKKATFTIKNNKSEKDFLLAIDALSRAISLH